MQKIKIFLICFLVSQLTFKKGSTVMALYHLKKFLDMSGINDFYFEKK